MISSFLKMIQKKKGKNLLRFRPRPLLEYKQWQWLRFHAINFRYKLEFQNVTKQQGCHLRHSVSAQHTGSATNRHQLVLELWCNMALTPGIRALFAVQIDTQVCPQRILVSNLPKKDSIDRILDKLEIHFSKSRNGGGEVEDLVMLEDSGNVVIKFIDSNSEYIIYKYILLI